MCRSDHQHGKVKKDGEAPSQHFIFYHPAISSSTSTLREKKPFYVCTRCECAVLSLQLSTLHPSVNPGATCSTRSHCSWKLNVCFFGESDHLKRSPWLTLLFFKKVSCPPTACIIWKVCLSVSKGGHMSPRATEVCFAKTSRQAVSS